jgi:hypothetical protein
MREYSGFFMSNLTPKQEKFALHIADGMTQADAYRAAYNCGSDTKAETIQKRASELMADGMIAGRVSDLRESLAELALWSRTDSVQTLKEIAQDHENKAAERVAAVKELNAMHGWHKQIIDHKSSDGSMTPTRIEIVAPHVHITD